jgi:subtilisin family serine protease
LPVRLVEFDESIPLKSYINSTTRPLSQIEFGETIIGKSIAPALARFSDRGQRFTNHSILKPDFTAPRVNIIVAWPQNLGPISLPEYTRRLNFSIMLGTSMTCPHVSGIAARTCSARPRLKI